jgi:hypothetical protein
MSFTAKFKAAGKELNVLDCDYSLRQEVDATGRPSSVTRGGRIRMTVESTSETDLFEWMCNNFERKDGSVVFYKAESEGTLKELIFKEGYLIEFEERFDSIGSTPMIINLTISAKEITMGRGTHKNEWV